MAAATAVCHDGLDFITGLVDSDAETEDQQLGAIDVQVADFTVEGTVQLPEKMPAWSMRSLSALGRWLHVEKETEHAQVMLVCKEDDLDTDEEEEGVFIDDVTEMYPPQVVHILDSENYDRRGEYAPDTFDPDTVVADSIGIALVAEKLSPVSCLLRSLFCQV